jgi:hypothetical protein
MLKINPALCFKPDDLINYISQIKDETTLAEEIAAAVTHRLVIEKEMGWNNYFIYFEPKDAKQTELLKKIGSTISFSELESFLKYFAAQDTPMDYAFINVNVRPADIYPVQHKRFYPSNSLSATENLIKSLDKWKLQYAPTETTFLIHYRGSIADVDLEVVMEWLNSNRFPFREVTLLLMTNKAPAFIQLLPNDGSGKVGFLCYSKEEMYDKTTR